QGGARLGGSPGAGAGAGAHRRVAQQRGCHPQRKVRRGSLSGGLLFCGLRPVNPPGQGARGRGLTRLRRGGVLRAGGGCLQEAEKAASWESLANTLRPPWWTVFGLCLLAIVLPAAALLLFLSLPRGWVLPVGLGL